MNKIKKVARNVSATYSMMFANCLTVMMALAADDKKADTTSTAFDSVGTKLVGLAESAITMLTNLIIPMASVAALCSIILMYLPGMSSRVTDRCKTVIWSCIATVVIAFAIKGVLTLARNIGDEINGVVAAA